MSIATTDLNLEVVEKGSNHSDTSSDETDRRRRTEKPNNGENAAAAVGRSYECTFCKRGFTNAQALGGHMNIHRKDKLKAKQKSSIPQQQQGSSPSPNSKNTHHQLYTSSRYFTKIPTDQQHFYPSPREAQHVGYMFYPSYQQVVHPNDDGSRPGNLGLHGDLMDANLTLRIGPQRREEDGEESKEEFEKNEVDLELRLGHHKYS